MGSIPAQGAYRRQPRISHINVSLSKLSEYILGRKFEKFSKIQKVKAPWGQGEGGCEPDQDVNEEEAAAVQVRDDAA